MNPSIPVLSYCANVHPGETLHDVLANLRQYTAPLRTELGFPIGVGLWLPQSVIDEMAARSGSLEHLKQGIQEADVLVETANAFPFGNFHAARVKEDVYRPDWTTVERRDYTCRVADVLAELLPEGGNGSISTVPLAWGRHHPFGVDTSIYRMRLVETARHLASIHRATGKCIRLAIEPEPGCVIESTEQAIQFFQEIWRATDSTSDREAVRKHLGLCFDICHQAVEYEEMARSIDRLVGGEVPIVKVHWSSALELADPTDDDAREELAEFAEQRYLHQTIGSHSSGRYLKLDDLDADWARDPGAEWLDCHSWRVHFHVPIHQSQLGRLGTTQRCLHEAAAAVRHLRDAPTLEVETYTWNVLRGRREHQVENDLVAGLAAELRYARDLLQACGETKGTP